tara:strand:+ start:123 stop:332 length:210 start_codon:yes stop_codon:yes gene_type:complete
MFELDDEEENIIQCIITLDYYTAKITYDALSFALDKWSGGEPQEQQDLQDTKNFFYAVYMELLLKNNRI